MVVDGIWEKELLGMIMLRSWLLAYECNSVETAYLAVWVYRSWHVACDSVENDGLEDGIEGRGCICPIEELFSDLRVLESGVIGSKLCLKYNLP